MHAKFHDHRSWGSGDIHADKQIQVEDLLYRFWGEFLNDDWWQFSSANGSLKYWRSRRIIPFHSTTLQRGLRKSRYKGTNRGTKGTILNQSLLRLLLVPQFPQKKYDFGDVHVPRFPYWKKLKNRGTNCVNSNSKDTLKLSFSTVWKN